jgi:hypothetical protein
MDARDRNRLKAYLSKLSPPVLAEADQVKWVSTLNAVQGRREPLKALSDLTAAEGHEIMSELDIDG